MHIPLSRTLNQILLGGYHQAQLKSSGWKFSQYRANMYSLEYKQWLKYYLPTGTTFQRGLTGKHILDIGAGEGETAKFYLDNNAYIVSAIEPDNQAYINLAYNAQHATKFLFPVHKYFELQDIEKAYPLYDLIKIDIEGYEEELLQIPYPKTPIIIEVHGLQLADKFRKAGYHVITPSRYGCLSYAYWKCMPSVQT